MKRNGLTATSLVLIVLMASLATFAKPKFINYQATLTNPSTGNPVPDNTYSMTFRIYEVEVGGTAMWTEIHPSVETKNGRFNVKLGEINLPNDTVFSDKDRWLGLMVSPDPEMSPRTAIGAVPYAFMAGNVPDTSINASKLGKESVGKDKIRRKDIDSTLISDATIGKDKIRRKDIDSTLIADKTVGKDKIRLKDIDSTLISDATIGKDKIRRKDIDSTLIADATIGKDKIRRKDIDSTLIADQTIGTDKIADGSILLADIAPNGASVAGQIMKWSDAPPGWVLGYDIGGPPGGDGWVRVGKYVILSNPTTDSVGIGVSAPSERLDVNGSILVRNKANIGNQNVNPGSYAFVAGSGNSASGDFSVVAGGGGTGPALGNQAQGTGSAICGGASNRATGSYTAVGGGWFNQAGIPGGGSFYATVGGGRNNFAAGTYSIVGGGDYNVANDSLTTVSGGRDNHANKDFATVSGGHSNYANGEYSIIGGGQGNEAGLTLPGITSAATIGGGMNNHAEGPYSTVGGGQGNQAGQSGLITGAATVGGGMLNLAYAPVSTVGGGTNNVVNLGGYGNTICGGSGNLASNNYSTVAGGYQNAALGGYSLAAGNHAKANHDGSVVIAATNSNFDVDSTRSGQVGQMVLRADGYFYLTNMSGQAPSGASAKFLGTSTGAYLTAGGVWTNSSDRDLKENFQEIDGHELLAQVARLPITRWNYKIEDKDITHIGPVAQDFRTVFGLGNDDKTISTIDPAGIALAAIQELLKQSEQKTARIEQLEAQMAEMKMLVHKLLEQGNGTEGKK